jgi:hypothetical protein
MAHQKPTNIHYSRLPSLRVDSVRAQHQSQDAVILPIEYELAEPNSATLHSETLIIPINWPISQFTAVLTSLEISDSQSDRKRKLALLKAKVESARKRAAKTKALQKERQSESAAVSSDSPNGQSAMNARSLKTAVPLLLLGVIVLVVFAWACFR